MLNRAYDQKAAWSSSNLTFSITQTSNPDISETAMPKKFLQQGFYSQIMWRKKSKH